MLRRPLYGEVFALSLAVILLEVSYTRIFSYKLFYYFTYLIIGLAMLGLGAGGVAVASSARLRATDTRRATALALLAAAAAAGAGYLVVARVQLNALGLARTLGGLEGAPVVDELAKLLAIAGAVFLPFFAAGLVLAKVFASETADIGRLYAADLVGAGIGCAACIPLMTWLGPPGCVWFSGLVFLFASVRVAATVRGARLLALALAVPLAAGVLMPSRLPDPIPDRLKTMAPIKGKPQRPIFSRWSPVFRVDVVPTFEDSFLLMHDGLWGARMQRFDGDATRLVEFDHDPRAYPFQLLGKDPRVAIIGAAGGHEILAALHLGAGHITAVELNPVTVSLLTTRFADVTGRLAENPRVTLLNAEGRSFLRRTPATFDLLWLVAPDSYAAMNAATAGAFVLSESYLYTTEMIHESLAHLAADGILCAQFGEPRFETEPMRTSRFLVTARAAFAEEGITDFARHVLVATSPAFGPLYATVMLRRAPFTDEEVERFRTFTAGIDGAQVRVPAMGEAARHPTAQVVQLPMPALATWLAAYPFKLAAVRDGAPFFWNFVRFRDAVFGRYKVTLTFEQATGERLLLILFGVATMLATGLLVLPLMLRRKVWRLVPHKALAGVYFAAIGFGFMFFEVSLIQRLTLLLGYPTYTLTVTMFSLLVSTGLGSLLLAPRLAQRRGLVALGIVLGAFVVFSRFALPSLVAAVGGTAFPVRVAVAMGVLAPLGLCLGVFMPMGLRVVAAAAPGNQAFVAWAWAANGFASVVGSVLSTLLAMAWGFDAVLECAALLYLVALLALAALRSAA